MQILGCSHIGVGSLTRRGARVRTCSIATHSSATYGARPSPRTRMTRSLRAMKRDPMRDRLAASGLASRRRCGRCEVPRAGCGSPFTAA